jgi:ribosome-associated protein
LGVSERQEEAKVSRNSWQRLRESLAKVGTNILPKVKSPIALRSRSSATYLVESREAAFMAANAAETKKAHGTVILDVSRVTLLADYFVIAGGDSASQVRAIVESVDKKLGELGYQLKSAEGKTDGRWVLLEYGDIIVHVLQEKERSFYKLEQFWNHALIVDRKEWLKAN